MSAIIFNGKTIPLSQACIKHNDRGFALGHGLFETILAKQEAMTQGYDEAILLNSESNVADGSITNIFIVKNERIYTPPVTDGALPGVVRSVLLKELKFEFSIMEQSISQEDLLNADEVFLTNALMGIQPVSKINEKNIVFFQLLTN